MTPLVCQESWYEWPAKHWQDCFTEVFPNWIDSLATGDATIGSYAIAAILCLPILLVIGGIFGAIGAVLEVTGNGAEDWFGRHPRTSLWTRIGLFNLIPVAIIGALIHDWLTYGWDADDALWPAIIIAVYYGISALICAGEWFRKRRERKTKAGEE